MASNYPAGLDTFDTIDADDRMSDQVGGRRHRDMHNGVNDAVEAVQAELGVDPAGSAATVAARLDGIESGERLGADSVGSAQIAANAVGSSELADNAVDTAAIAASAVTSAKIADGTIVSGDVAAGTFAAFGTVGNLLTANQASIETDTTGLDAHSNCTISRTTSQAYHGSASLQVTCNGAGDAAFRAYGGTFAAVIAGETYTATVALKSAATARTARIYVWWYTAANAFIDGSTSGAFTTSTSSWKVLSDSVVAPATAAKALVYVIVFSPAASEIHYADCFGLWRGAGGKWQLPGVPIPGQSHIATNGAVHLSGTGTPEGVVTAAPGSTWLQTDSTTDVKGWLRWVKATGTGNTGWVAGPETDTGRRSLTLVNNWTGFAYVRRIGSVVHVRLSLTAPTTVQGWNATFVNDVAPTGFRPDSGPGRSYATGYVAATRATASATVVWARWSAASGMQISAAAGTPDNTWGVFDVGFSFVTNDAWPASLPGSAA